jgi:hypothetical protein
MENLRNLETGAIARIICSVLRDRNEAKISEYFLDLEFNKSENQRRHIKFDIFQPIASFEVTTRW